MPLSTQGALAVADAQVADAELGELSGQEGGPLQGGASNLSERSSSLAHIARTVSALGALGSGPVPVPTLGELRGDSFYGSPSIANEFAAYAPEGREGSQMVPPGLRTAVSGALGIGYGAPGSHDPISCCARLEREESRISAASLAEGGGDFDDMPHGAQAAGFCSAPS